MGQFRSSTDGGSPSRGGGGEQGQLFCEEGCKDAFYLGHGIMRFPGFSFVVFMQIDTMNSRREFKFFVVIDVANDLLEGVRLLSRIFFCMRSLMF